MANENIARIRAPKAPNLPIPTIGYSQTYFEILTNVLRLYFNELDKVFATLVTPDTGYYLNQPYGGFYDSTTQNATLANTAYPVSFNTQYQIDNPRFLGGAPDIYIDPTASVSAIVILYPGVYNVAYNVQLENTDAATHTVWVWINKNGTALTGSVTPIDVIAGAKINVNNSFILEPTTSGDYIELMWATDNTAIQIVPRSATTFCPASPSAILNVTYASA